MKTEDTDNIYDSIDQIVVRSVQRGLAHLSAEDEVLGGRTVRLGGQDVINLGTASYMHLERHPALLSGAMDFLQRYGTQFSSSRAYLQLDAYNELEDNLGRIFGRPALVAASTTLGHLSAIPVLVDSRDVIILDQQVHSSIQTVVQIPRSRGVPVHIIRHNDMDGLEERIRRLQGQHRRVWYFADGIYSMFGDGAPVEVLHGLMDRYAALRVYIDDAHGFGWTGPHGCGWVRARIPHHDQLILAVSLNKAYASAGGALIFPDQETKARVRNCGPTMIFSGPIQPPMLGACLAASRLHLSDDILPLQAELAERVARCREGLEARGIPQIVANDTPLYFIPTGMPRLVQDITQRLLRDGFYVNLGTFPAVPVTTGGVRFHMHRGLSLTDIDDFLDRLAVHYKAVLAAEGTTPRKLAQAFRLPHLKDVDLGMAAPVGPVHTPAPARPSALQVHARDDIAAVPAELWDACFAGRGPMSHAALSTLAPAFAAAPAESAAKSRFVWITDPEGRVVLATFFSVTRIKEDMFASEEISRRVEAQRRVEGADFLVSPAVVLGLPITLGRHLYLDREHAGWKAAVRMLLGLLLREKEAAGASQILLREFETGADPELLQVLEEQGFIEARLPSMMTMPSLSWSDRGGYLASLSSRYRYDVRREILPHLDRIRVDARSDLSEGEIDACYALYQRVHARGLRLNVLPLPRSVFGAMIRGAEFDVQRYFVQEAGPDGGPAVERLGGVMLSHARAQHYSALLVGFDEDLIETHAIYKAALFLTVERARAMGARSVNLAYTAELVKKKIGARPQATSAYALVDDTYGANVLMSI